MAVLKPCLRRYGLSCVKKLDATLSKRKGGVDARFILARAQGFGAAWDGQRLDLGIAANIPEERPAHRPPVKQIWIYASSIND